MLVDEHLAREAIPTVRLFRWDPPACSLGWKQPAPAWLDVPGFLAEGLEVVERPTGGGAAFHGSDLSCAVVAPIRTNRSLPQLMARLCEAVTQACRSFGVEAHRQLDGPSVRRIAVCLTEPSPYAIYAGRRKLAGFAVRRYRESWLVQGSLLVQPFPGALLRVLPVGVRASLARRALSLSEAAGCLVREEDVAERVVEGLDPAWEAS